MNILYTNFHRGLGGGHTTYILSLLKNPEHKKVVACPPTSRLYAILRDERYPLLYGLDFPSRIGELRAIVKNVRALKNIIEKEDIDIVHTNGSPDNRMALYASLFGKKTFRTVFTKHNILPITGIISKYRFNHFNQAVIFVSATILDALALRRDFSRYHVIENCVDLSYWHKNEPVQTGDHLTLASNAGASPRKGWTYLVDAVASLPEEMKKRLSIVVMGSLYTEDMERELREAPAKCDIHFTGFLEDTRPLLEKADIGFVLSYKIETCSFASREMSGMSLPVMVSDFAGLVNNVDESCGWVTKPRDADSIRQTLLEILALSPEKLNGMKFAARKRAEEQFSISKMIGETNAVYASLSG
ncbi:transferase [Deltaproteobacteria bacterium]|nr:transferase [Deltaproteobacteria bacterium]